MKNNKAHKAALKAWKTIRARRAFANRYSKTYQIAMDLIHGYSTPTTALFNNVSTGTVAAVLANLRRNGTYRSMAKACRF